MTSRLQEAFSKEDRSDSINEEVCDSYHRLLRSLLGARLKHAFVASVIRAEELH